MIVIFSIFSSLDHDIYINPFTMVVTIWYRKSVFFKMNIKSKPSFIYIQTFFEHILYTLGSISVYSVLKRPELRKFMLFIADHEISGS